MKKKKRKMEETYDGKEDGKKERKDGRNIKKKNRTGEIRRGKE